jgi:transposase
VQVNTIFDEGVNMKNDAARKLKMVPPNYLLIGIDPHKKTHAAVAMTYDLVVHTRFKFSNSSEGFASLVQRMQDLMIKTGSSGVLFSIEAAGHYWRNFGYFLNSRGFQFRLVNPFTLKRIRDGRENNQRKNDYHDAQMAAELLRNGDFVETRLPRGIYAELRALHSAHRRLVQERARMKNLLKGLLDGIFPEFTQVFKNVCGMTALEVLSVCPSPRVITSLKIEDFVGLVKREFKGRAPKIHKLGDLHSLARTSVGIEVASDSVSLELGFLVKRLQLLNKQICEVEKAMIAVLQAIPDASYLMSIHGISYMTVAGILAELGPLREYRSASQLVKMAGTNPTEWESAGKRSVHTPISKKGRPGLRWCLWTAARSLLRHNKDFRQWAKERLERPAHLHPLKMREVFGAVVNRLLRVSFALVKKETFYRTPVPHGATEFQLVTV